MKNITNDYKTEICKFGKQLDSKITYELNGETIELGKSQLNSVTPHYESDILKSVMKQLDIDSNVEIPVGTILTYEFGILVNNSYEYINYGNYVVNKVEKQEDLRSWKITCYDKMLYSMKDYEKLTKYILTEDTTFQDKAYYELENNQYIEYTGPTTGDPSALDLYELEEVTYPITIRNYINTICEYLGLTFANNNETFANYNREIQKELYLDENGGSLGYTFRDVFDELAQVTGSIICINNDDELEIRYINNTQDTIDGKYLKDINVNFGEKYGPVNSIVLSRASEADSVYLKDDESIAENGLCEIKIKENQIMNFNDRSDYLPDLLEVLDGLEYYINDFTSTGITYYEVGDMYNISIDNNTYKCIMFNDEVNITQGLEELVHTDMPETSETDYNKADKTDRKINQTYIIADKQQGQIEALTSRTSNLEDETGNMYTKEQVDILFQNAETGVTNTFSEAGGNNIFRNTGLWFESGDSNNPYEFWDGIVVRESNELATNRNSLKLQNGTLFQEEQIPKGNYTVSFKYKKLIDLANVKCIINDAEYTLSETTDTEFTQTIEVNNQHIKVQFVSDTDNACEVYDLMVNAGAVKLAYSQNQNETTTDTVNISKGITITSSDNENIVFKANYDGVRIYEKSNMTTPKTKFTYKGTETNYLEVKDEAVVVDILIQRVGSQTWLTKI